MAKEFKYNYVICTRADYDTYRKQCAALEKHVPDLVKEKSCMMLMIADTSTIGMEIKR